MRNNPSEYWKNNVQKAAEAHDNSRSYVLGDIHSLYGDRDLSGVNLSGKSLAFANFRKRTCKEQTSSALF